MPSMRILAALVVPTLLVPAWAGPVSARPLPDLVTKGVRIDVDSVAQGGSIRVTDTTANVGRAKAGRSQTRYYLSADRALGRPDRLLGSRAVAAVKPGRKRTGSTTVTVPSATPVRGWYVLACADGRKAVKEAREGNNCTATKGRVAVTEPAAEIFPMPADPLAVTSTLQDDRAVTETAYPHEAKTISATAADGTTYTLVIPVDALLGQQEITMTPLAAVPDLPLSDGVVAGVQLEPHGLMLLKPAELTITRPAESGGLGPLARQTAFLFHEDGADFHLYPMGAPEASDDQNTVRLSLTHFSTPGIGSGSAEDRSSVAERVPNRTLAQAEGAISELLRQERQNQLNGAELNPEVVQQVTAIMDALYDDVISKQMQAAETDATLAAEAIAAGLGWSRQMQLLGDEDNPRHAEIMARVEKILRNVMNQNWQDCLDHDLSATLDLLRVARTAALMGYGWQGEAMDKLQGCGRFEVRFDSEINTSSSYSGTLQSGSTQGMWHTRGTVDTKMFEPNNTGPLGWVGFSYAWENTIHDADPDCHMSESGVSTAPGRMRAFAMPLLGSINVLEGDRTASPVPVLTSVDVVPGAAPTETYTHMTCDGSTSTLTDSKWYWHYESSGKNWTTDPGQQAEDFIDSRTFTISEPTTGGSHSEVTTVEVWHKPAL